MSGFNQLGDPPTAAACLCQHHGAEYAEACGAGEDAPYYIPPLGVPPGTAAISQAIVLTERCCIAINSALVSFYTHPVTEWEIERPIGTIRTTQEDSIISGQIVLMHHAAWEVLDPGTYTYYLVNHSAWTRGIFATWIKIIASDCEG